MAGIAAAGSGMILVITAIALIAVLWVLGES